MWEASGEASQAKACDTNVKQRGDGTWMSPWLPLPIGTLSSARSQQKAPSHLQRSQWKQDQAAELTDSGVGAKATTSRSTSHGFSSLVSGRFPHWALWGSSARAARLGYSGIEPGTGRFLYLQGNSWDARTPLHSFGPSSLIKPMDILQLLTWLWGLPEKREK